MGTVIIRLTPNYRWFGFYAGYSWVSDVACRTSTDWFVVLYPAVSIGSAWISDSAGIKALSVDAGIVVGAFTVIPAFGLRWINWCWRNLHALNSWVA